MEAPEKIYCGNNGYGNLSYSNLPFPNAVEYTRTDAFVKKACEVFCKVRCKGKPPRSTCTSLGTCREHDEFKKALKGE